MFKNNNPLIAKLMTDCSKYIGKGLTGLANLGNTCFLNSTMQVLSHTYEFNDFLDKGTYRESLNDCPDSILLVEWDKLRQLMWSENCCVSPGGFVQGVQKVASQSGREVFTGWAQNDLPEFLMFWFEGIHKALQRPVVMNIRGKSQNNQDKMAVKCFEMMKKMYSKEYSEVVKLFTGIQVSVITSLQGVEHSVSPEPVILVSLPMPNLPSIDLVDCIKLYTTPELMNHENAWYNDKTKQREDVHKKLSFWMLPEILIMDVKRFDNRNRKNNKMITAPLQSLDMSPYVLGYGKRSYVYDLYGVCNHMGGVHGGHYTANVLNANGKWYEFNDTRVTEIDASRVVTSAAYCFFYRKKK
jgi:ubiquitin carboxyl-terminal hydrolase 8